MKNLFKKTHVNLFLLIFVLFIILCYLSTMSNKTNFISNNIRNNFSEGNNQPTGQPTGQPTSSDPDQDDDVNSNDVLIGSKHYVVGNPSLGADMFQLLFGKDDKIAELNSRPHLSNDITSQDGYGNNSYTDFGINGYDNASLDYISQMVEDVNQGPRPVVIQEGVKGVSNIFAPYIVEE